MDGVPPASTLESNVVSRTHLPRSHRDQRTLAGPCGVRLVSEETSGWPLGVGAVTLCAWSHDFSRVW